MYLKAKYLSVAATCVGLLVTGCGRDTSTPAKTLIGHWTTTRNGSEEVHNCYSSDGNAVYFNKTTDKIEKLPYRVLSESPEAKIAKVEIGYNGTVEDIQFINDGNEAVVRFDGLSLTEPDRWKYVDTNSQGCG